MPVVNSNVVQMSHIDKPFERDLKIIMSPQTHSDVEGFTFLISTLAPDGGCTDFHGHETSGELMIFLSGRGKAWLDKEEFDIFPGISMYAPPGIPHKTLNTGTEPLAIACVFVPSVNTDYIKANIEASQKARGEKK